MSVRTDATAAPPALTARSVSDRIRAGSLAIDIALVCAVSLVLGLIRLGAPSLWFDEAYTYRQIHKGYLAQFEGYQPFYYWVHKPWSEIAGTSEWAMRFPSVVGAMVAGALLVVLARKLFDRRVALVSGLLLATSPYFVKWSQQARAYTLIAAVGILATLLLLRALERGSRGAWAVYGLAFTGLLVTHAVAGLFLVPAHAVLIAQRRDRALPHGLLAGVIVAALGIPWVAQLSMRTDSSTSETAWIPFPSAEYATRALLDLSGIAGLGVVLAAAGLWVLGRAGERQRAVWLAAWALAPWVLALLISLARPVFVDRYLIVAAPAFAMLAAVAVVSAADRLRLGVVAVVAGATAIGLVVWYSSAADGNWRGEDWRSAASYVLQHQEDADVVVVPWWTHDAAQYYEAPAADTSTADSIWVLHWSEDGPEVSPQMRRALGFGEHTLVENRQFGWRVSAQRWERRG